MRRNGEPYSEEIWWVIGINIAANILLALKCFVATAGIFLKDDSGTAPIHRRKSCGSVKHI
jgi:hypothetical protein